VQRVRVLVFDDNFHIHVVVSWATFDGAFRNVLSWRARSNQGMVFRVQADTAEQAAEQVIGLVGGNAVIGALYDADQVLGDGEPIGVVDGAVDPRLLPPLSFGPPGDPPDNDDSLGWGWGPQ